MSIFCFRNARIILLLGLGLSLTACTGETNSDEQKPKFKPSAPVLIGYVEEQLVVDEIEAVGTLQASESVFITATVTDHVSSINFEDGQKVNKNDILVTLTSDEQVAELDEAQANLKESIRQLERLENIGGSFASESALDLARASVDANKARLEVIKARLADRIITAPFSGVLGVRKISVGALVTPGTEIARLDDINVLNLDFTIPEIYSNDLTSSSQVSATNSSMVGRSFEGKVAFVDKRVDPATRAVLVRAKIPNPDMSLFPGMLMNVSLYSKEYLAAIVPESALQQVGDNSSIYVVKDDQSVEKRKVTIGRRLPGKIVINDGVAIGEKIVVDGTLTLRQGSKVSIKNPELLPQVSSSDVDIAQRD